MLVVCKNCYKDFDKLQREIKRSPNHYCSRSCSASYHNRHVGTRLKRSIFEIWISMQISKEFGDLEVYYNRKDIIGGELDIYIPSFQLAFEINGISHKKPIYGKKQLQLVRKNDKLKKETCKSKGIELIVVDTSDMPHFKHYNLEKHTNFILSEVRKRLETREP